MVDLIGLSRIIKSSAVAYVVRITVSPNILVQRTRILLHRILSENVRD